MEPRWDTVNDARSQRADSLDIALDTLVSMNSQLEFVLAASHDLQEPLRSMVHRLQELLAGEHSLRPEQRSAVLELLQEARQMRELARSLTAYSRESLAAPVEERPVDLTTLVAEVKYSLGSLIEETGATIFVGKMPLISGDWIAVRRVFQNLLQNSMKFRRAGFDPEIYVNAADRGDAIEICVRDNGTGFDSMYSEKIFAPFQRLHSKTVSGVGLGLAICRIIVARHGGQIWAQSTPGQGACFYFTLPHWRGERRA